MIRILQVVTHMNRGGLETMLMNYFRNIDRNNIQFDFLTHRPYEGDYGDEIKKLGGKIYHLPALNPFSHTYKTNLDSFFKEHPEYCIIHVHQDCMSSVILKIAENNGIPCRIAHSHGASQEKNLKYLIKIFYRHYIPVYATELMACSQKAGEWMFCGAPFVVLNNAIDAEKYRFNQTERKNTREILGFDEKQLVIGHVGRIDPPKNHSFLIEIFEEVKKRLPNAILLLVGNAKTRCGEKIYNIVEKKNLLSSVRFLGVQSNVSNFLQAMDVFVFPSLWEGLSLASIEAQAAGLPTFISDHVSIECKKTDLVHVLPLQETASNWAEKLIEVFNRTKRQDTLDQIRDAGFDIKDSAIKLESFYIERAVQRRIQ